MKKIFQITNSKKRIIISIILSAISVLLIGYLISYFRLLYKDKSYLKELLYPIYSGYKGFNNAFIIFLIIAIIYLLLIPIICIKKRLSIKCLILVFVILFIYSMVLSVTYSAQFTSKNVCSYTTNIDNYGKYDDDKLDYYFKEYLPLRNEVTRFLYKAKYNLGTTDNLKYQSYANIMVLFEEERYNKIVNDELIKKYTVKEIYQKNITDFNKYEFYYLKESNYNLIIMINKDINAIVYSIYTDHINLFDKTDDFIMNFIYGHNTYPYQ